MYCYDTKYKRNGDEHRGFCNTIKDVRHWLKFALQTGEIYPESIKVFHGVDSFKVDVTRWALEPLQHLIKE